jgi:hypothetical protein
VEDKRLLWLVLVAAWIALAACFLLTFRPHLLPHQPRESSIPEGTYQRVKDVVPPLALGLQNGWLVQPGGVLPPQDPAEATRAAARLRELAPPGTEVYVEFDSGRAPRLSEAAPIPASIWLPPPGVARAELFPYAEARLVGAVLVQEGLVRVADEQSYLYRNELLLLEDDARRHHRGIWASK